MAKPGLPKWNAIWPLYNTSGPDAFKTDTFSPEELSKLNKRFGTQFNTCALRISEALNRLGPEHHIPKFFQGARTAYRKGTVKYNAPDEAYIEPKRVSYISGTITMRRYFDAKYGGGQDLPVKGGGKAARASIEGVPGFIVFQFSYVNGPRLDTESSGHFTLWNGEFLLYGDPYFDYEFFGEPPPPSYKQHKKWISGVRFWRVAWD